LLPRYSTDQPTRTTRTSRKVTSRAFTLSYGYLMTAEVERKQTQANRTWMCLICGWIYDEAAGYPDDGIAPGTRWEEVPINWTCPECGARKDDFEMVEI
jgi:rubredoxin